MVAGSEQPFLYVNIRWLGTATAGYGYAYCVLVKLQQVLKASGGWKGYAVTWETGAFGLTPAAGAANTIRSIVKDQVDKFLNDYLSVNPKK